MAILINSVPKAGSNLLKNLVLAMPGMPDGAEYIPVLHMATVAERLKLFNERMIEPPDVGVYTAHCPYSPEIEAWLREREVKTVFLRRDPRDVVVSFAHYIESNRKHGYHALLMELPDHDARLKAVIEGRGATPAKAVFNAETFPGIHALCAGFMPWELCGSVHVMFYEELCDARLGWPAVRALARYLGVSVYVAGTVWKAQYAGQGSTQSVTYRRGRVGSFRTEFTAAHYAAFYREVGDLLPELMQRGWM